MAAGKLSATERIRPPGAAGPKVQQVAAPVPIMRQGEVLCPFTGMPIEIRMVSADGLFMAIGPFWSSKLFNSKPELMAAMASRPGKTVAAPVVSVTESVEAEEDPVKDLADLAKSAGDKYEAENA